MAQVGAFIRFMLVALLTVLSTSAMPQGTSEKADKVLVVKSERQLYLLQESQVLRSYRIALGSNPVGHKVFQGDGRTPEGLYTLDWRNIGSRFYRAIHISYPNEEDIDRAARFGGQPGGLIMIHGQPLDGFAGANPYYDWTEGCIALSNREMDEVWMAVDDGTPIEILP
ncbi:MAG: L,D-transpeptidase family protein [Rhodospirillales bacterium]